MKKDKSEVSTKSYITGFDSILVDHRNTFRFLKNKLKEEDIKDYRISCFLSMMFYFEGIIDLALFIKEGKRIKDLPQTIMEESNDLPDDEIYLRFFMKANEAHDLIFGSIEERLKYLENLDKKEKKIIVDLYKLRNAIVHPSVTLYDEKGSRNLKKPSKKLLTPAEISNEIKLDKINSIYEFIMKTTQNILSAYDIKSLVRLRRNTKNPDQ